jgi:hypothetical protein
VSSDTILITVVVLMLIGVVLAIEVGISPAS